MPTFKFIIRVATEHEVVVNHPTLTAAIEDAKAIAERHTEGKVVEVIAKSHERIPPCLINDGPCPHKVDGRVACWDKGLGGGLDITKCPQE